MRAVLRMERSLDLEGPAPIPGVVVRAYDRARDHGTIPDVYAASFGDDPWPTEWDAFREFDPLGACVAETSDDGLVGFALSFRRGDVGYISVVAVAPGHRRRGIASALVRHTARYLRTLGLARVQIDAYGDSPAAVATYWRLGFRVSDLVIEESDPNRTRAG